jgi:prophage antirepressor-like protein
MTQMKLWQQPFVYEGRDVRIISLNGQPWFVAADVCSVLDISKHRDAVSRLDEDERGSVLVDTPGGQQQMAAISEAGLYSLIMVSRKPEAKAFKRWVTHEVLPEIRKTGGYYLPKTLPDALRLAADLAEENETLKPKAEMHDLFLAADNAQPMKEVADAVGVGRNTLFKLLREKKILTSQNIPYRRYLDRGYFKVIEKTIEMGGQVINKPQTLVTPKGIDYIGRIIRDKSA